MSPTFLAGERPRPDWLREHPRAWVAAVATVCFGALMGQLDASVVALTYHSIGDTFDAGLGSVQWVSLTYLITLGTLLVPVGRISDRFGRKRIYVWGFAVFTLASAACALAPTLASLAALRSVQGVGAAMLQANGLALVATSTPSGRLRTALGLQASAQAVGLAIGPTVGGLVVQTVGWRWVFGLNVPVGILAVIAGRYLLPRTRIEPAERTGVRETLRRPGMMPGLAGALFAYLLLFGPIVLVPALLQAHGTSAWQAGLLVACLPAGFALGASAEGALPRRWTARAHRRTGLLSTAAGIGALLLLGVTPGTSAVALAVTGLGLGIFTPTNNAEIIRAVPARLAALAGGLVSTVRAAGTAIGTAVVAASLAVDAGGRLALAALAAVVAAAAVMQ